MAQKGQQAKCHNMLACCVALQPVDSGVKTKSRNQSNKKPSHTPRGPEAELNMICKQCFGFTAT